MKRTIGILETSGTFVVDIMKNDNYNSGYAINIVLLSKNKDKDVLNYLSDKLSSRGIEVTKYENRIVVKGIDNLKTLIEFVDLQEGFVSNRKQKKYEVWKKIVELVDDEEHKFPEGIVKIKRWKRKMMKI